MPSKPPAILSFGSRLVDQGDHRWIWSFGDLQSSGGLHASRLRILGDGEIQGRCTVDHLFAAGNVRVFESLRAEDLRCLGNMIINGQLDAAKLRAFGDLSVTGRVTCQRFQLWGDATLSENLIAEYVSLTGSCRIRGLLSGERIRIKSRGYCEINEIGGSAITIRAGWNEDGCRDSNSLLNWRCKGTTRARLIEGDVINLENTTADIVRGQTISLGRGCRIGTLEVGESLLQHPSSSVERIERLIPTAELHRESYACGELDE